jgi:DNA-binding NarL/FixJ family response regulator
LGNGILVARIGNRRDRGSKEESLNTPSIRVLIVDDYEPWYRFVSNTLQNHSKFEIIAAATDGLEAVQKARELQPDLILLDIGLPSLNGIEVGRRIRELSPKSKILFLSENRDAEVAQEALNTGAGGYVVKSDAGSDLLPAVKAVLEGKRFISASLAGQFLVATALTSQTISWIVALTLGIR